MLNPFVVNFIALDVGNFGPNLRVFHTAPFFQQRTSIDFKLYLRDRQPFSRQVLKSLGQSIIFNSSRDVSWRSPLHSNVCILDIFHSSREVREGGSNAKPPLGKELTPSHGPPIERWISMPIEVREMSSSVIFRNS
jgi:hypothetical protein